MHFDLISLIKTFSYLGVFTLVFLESGLLIGFLFPGDSLLFTAGFLASQGFLDIYILITGCFIFAVLGDTIGYFIGKKMGPKIFKKNNSIIFNINHLKKAQKFYDKHGGKTIILARFMPIVRAFAPIVAGAGEMDYKKFMIFNLAGGVFWAIGITGAGYYLGSIIPNIDKYLFPIIGIIILASISPALHAILINAEIRASIINKFKKGI
ncbi:membrane protein [Candidatus Levyibacteriota bacterium]|nr:membrane protein [Candidatus Levybacteria bacterium]